MAMLGLLLLSAVLSIGGMAITGFAILFGLRFAFRFITAPPGGRPPQGAEAPRALPVGKVTPAGSGSFSEAGSLRPTNGGRLLPELDLLRAGQLAAACLLGVWVQNILQGVVVGDEGEVLVAGVLLLPSLWLAWLLVKQRTPWVGLVAVVLNGLNVFAEAYDVARDEGGALWFILAGVLFWGAVVGWVNLRRKRVAASATGEVSSAVSASVQPAFNQAPASELSEAVLPEPKPKGLGRGAAVGGLVIGAIVVVRIALVARHFLPQPAPVPAPAPTAASAAASPAAAPATPAEHAPAAASSPPAPEGAAVTAPTESAPSSMPNYQPPPGYFGIPLSINDDIQIVQDETTTYDMGGASLWIALQRAGFNGGEYGNRKNMEVYYVWDRGDQRLTFHASTGGAGFVYIDRLIGQIGGQSPATFTGSALKQAVERFTGQALPPP